VLARHGYTMYRADAAFRLGRAGYEIFSGTFCLQAFGEFIEHANDTPPSRRDLKAWQDEAATW